MPAPTEIHAPWQELTAELRRYFRRRLNDAALADDLTQETLLRLQHELERSGLPARLRAWVFRVAHNLVVDQYRRRGTPQPLDEAAAQAAAAEADEPALNERVGRWLAVATATLPATTRDAVRLHELDGLPMKQVAQELKISLPAAKSRVLRGREQLRRALLDCCSLRFDRRGNVVDWARRPDASCGCDDCE